MEYRWLTVLGEIYFGDPFTSYVSISGLVGILSTLLLPRDLISFSGRRTDSQKLRESNPVSFLLESNVNLTTFDACTITHAHLACHLFEMGGNILGTYLIFIIHR
jgi:hypothetical protein